MLAGAAFAEDAVKIGVTQPLTGAFAADGNYVAQGAKLAAEAINKAGGIDGKQFSSSSRTTSRTRPRPPPLPSV